MSRKTIYTLVWAGMALLAVAATVKISEYPAVTTPADSDQFILASGSTNKNITYANLKTSVNTGQATSAQLASATNLSRQAATNEAKTYTDAQITGLSSTYATPAQLLSATNLAVQTATNSAKAYTDAQIATVEASGLSFLPQLGSETLTNLTVLEALTNGHTAAITLNNNLTINGNFTVNSTNATTTVSNIVVNGTLAGAGVNTVSNATWGASKTYADSTFVTTTQHNADTNSIYHAATNAAKAYHDANTGSASNPLLDLTVDIVREPFASQNTVTTSVGTHGWGYNKKGSAYGASATPVAGHPGLFSLVTGTTIEEGALIILAGNTNGPLSGYYPPLNATTGWTNTWVFKLSATNDVTMWIGLTEPGEFDFLTVEPNDWMGLIVASGSSAKFRYTTRAASTSSFADSANLDPNASAAWHTFRMWSTVAGTIAFSLDGANVQTLNANVPDSNLSPFAAVWKSGANNTVTLYLDEWVGVLTGLTR